VHLVAGRFAGEAGLAVRRFRGIPWQAGAPSRAMHGMSPLHDSILGTVGRTPVVRVNRLAPPGRELYVKCEAFNPLGSVKDRMALGVIEAAEASGALRPGQTVIEATSGNTGIGLAMVCAAKGYPLVVVMAESFSLERRRILRFLGAKVVLTPASLRGTGMLDKARELADAHGWFLCRQFESPANADVHSRTTAREILEDFAGRRLDYWVTGYGTGGTLLGVARVLRAERPDTRVVVCEADNSRLLASGVAQPRRADGSPAGGHPAFSTHPVQGWAPDFVPLLAEEAQALVHELEPVSGADAISASRELAAREGIFTGISGGATFAGARQVAARAPEGSAVLCMLPDTGERYLSTPLFENVPAEMTEEELELSRSTPSARFDAPAVPDGERRPEPGPEAAAFVDEALARRDPPVVVFALEWCEFCWAVRKLLDALGLSHRAVEMDSVELAAGGLGDRLRAELERRTGARTVPQVFVGGELVGGCSETFEALETGRLQRLAAAQGIELDSSRVRRAADFLPAWLHPR
jgi:cysteine synthase A